LRVLAAGLVGEASDLPRDAVEGDNAWSVETAFWQAVEGIAEDVVNKVLRAVGASDGPPRGSQGGGTRGACGRGGGACSARGRGGGAGSGARSGTRGRGVPRSARRGRGRDSALRGPDRVQFESEKARREYALCHSLCTVCLSPQHQCAACPSSKASPVGSGAPAAVSPVKQDAKKPQEAQEPRVSNAQAPELAAHYFTAPRARLSFQHVVVPVVLDTGADVCLMTAPCWKRLKKVARVVRQGPWVRGGIAGIGEGRVVPGKAVTIELRFGERLVEAEFGVVRKAPEAMLLGMSTMGRCGMRILLDEGVVEPQGERTHRDLPRAAPHL